MSSSKTLFNDNWTFAKFPLGTPYETMDRDGSFHRVSVPHDWMIYDTSDLYEDSIGFYRKKFCVQKTGGHTYIVRFGCVYMDTVIYLNGAPVFEWKNGYSAFEVNITDVLLDGENVIDVVSTYRSPNTRWYSGAGIFRNVWFYDKDAAYIPVDGLYLSSAQKDGGAWELCLDCEVTASKPMDGTLLHEIFDRDGRLIGQTEVYVPLCREVYVSKSTVIIDSPKLWDADDPYLYTVRTTLSVNGEALDTISTAHGFRTLRFDSEKGFFLNGRNVKINGACQHHDLGALGAAVNVTALKRQVMKLKAMGVNAIRTSHNMPSDELLEIADKEGVLIDCEAFDMWELSKTANDYSRFFPEWWKKDTRSWIRQARNHPCVFIWSIGNEIYDCHAGSGDKWNILLRDAVKEYDYRHNAYIASASNYMEWEGAQRCADALELAGYNYGEKLYDLHHEQHPDRCIFGSETSSTVQSRGIYHFPLEKKLLTHDDGQCSCLGNCTVNWGAKDVDAVISEHRDRDYVFGQFIWTGWDYIGEPTPYFTKNSYFGQIDTAGFEKDTFYHYQAEWTDYKKSPMVHLLPYWDFNRGQIIDVCIYSNAPTVGLFLNGEPVGKQDIDHARGKSLKAVYKIPYEPGTLRAEAYDENGNIIAIDEVTSFTDPAKLVLNPDKKTLLANPDDLIFIEISCVDKDGHPVANARNRCCVSVTGAGILVGLDNGDSTDYEQYKGSSRKMFSGKLLAIIASNGETGDIFVKVTSENLPDAELTLNAEKASVPAGAVYMTPNYPSEEKHDVPIRRIDMLAPGFSEFTPERAEADVRFEVLPSCATYDDITVKAMTGDGVEANFVDIEMKDDAVHVVCRGDGEFKLTACAGNGSGLSEIVSELEFRASGLGSVTTDPYELVPGISFSSCSEKDAKVSFSGGVFIPANERGESFVSYENVDFGSFGSDEVTVPVFIFENEMPVSVWDGDAETGECLGRFVYRAPSLYNHYQENTFKLSRRIKGIRTVTFRFELENRISFKGFSFKKLEKAYEKISAAENSGITGDRFTVEADAVTGIGNNVVIDFDSMNFVDGLSAITVCGRSNNEKTSVHMFFCDDDVKIRRMIEIPYSKEYSEYNFPLEDLTVSGKVGFLFLPGSDFDMKWFRFERRK